MAIVLYGREPREVFEFRRLREALASVVSDSDADGIVIEYAGLAPLIAYRTRRDTPWILTLHNVGSVMERQEQALYGGGRRAWLHRRDAKIWERWESCVPAGYDLLVAVSPDDAAYFNERTGRLPAVIPNGVDTDRFHMTDVPKHPKLIFTGALNTGPNYYGLLWFCREIWPLIQRDHPAATFDVVGSNAPPQILDLRRLPGVTVHVDVPDIVPYLRDARVSVVPLKIGTGTRLKALEAMAAGRPIVGTSVGLGGLEISAGVHAEIADDPKSFSERVCRLLTDDGYAAVLTQAARQLVEERYSWSAIGADYVTLVTRALR